MKTGRIILLAAFVLLAGCGASELAGEAGDDSERRSDGSWSESGSDASAPDDPSKISPTDASRDFGTDASTESAADAAADASMDPAADASTDASTEPADASSDASLEPGADASADASTDGTADAATDARDGSTDGSPDASSDASTPPPTGGFRPFESADGEIPGVPSCNSKRPHRKQLFFGDLHVHTRASDDVVNFWLSRSAPTADAAYKFARGVASITTGLPGKTLSIGRAIDFAAVTDHVQWIGADWSATKVAADANYTSGDGSNCSFTPFVGFEWSGWEDGTGPGQIHRNIIFRSDQVPAGDRADAFTPSNKPTPNSLWTALESECAAPGCDFISIPHNSNRSNGSMFGAGSDPVVFARRARHETVVEIIQHKGSSECRNHVGLTDDATCAFEELSADQSTSFSCAGAVTADDIPLCKPLSYVRGGLLQGLDLRRSGMTNPLRFGFVGGTDTHNGTGGYTEENLWEGHEGDEDDSPAERLNGSFVFRNPGGLTGVWAEQNRRGAIFSALDRREVYATSGSRIKVRFFGGWRSDVTGVFSQDELCGDPYPGYDSARYDTMVDVGYARGVPMGGVLEKSDRPVDDLGRFEPGAAPRFLVWAEKDSGGLGRQLQRLDIVKLWVDVDGQRHESVISAAPNFNTGPRDRLCATWTDSAFDLRQHAVYYARIYEVPGETWRSYDGGRGRAGAQYSSSQRAWTSPIWFDASL